jgi:hypothetical protein
MKSYESSHVQQRCAQIRAQTPLVESSARACIEVELELSLESVSDASRFGG